MPTVDAWRLQRILRELRRTAGLSAEKVAHALGWSESRLTRLETTSQLPRVDAVVALLDYYGVSGAQRKAVLSLVDGTRQPSPWETYSGILPAGTLTFLALEESAGMLLMLATQNVPSVLMTTDYATGVLAGNLPDEDSHAVEAATAEIQPHREARVDGPDRPHIWAVLDEAVLYRTITSREVTRLQLERLLNLVEAQRIRLQILRFEDGWHRGKAPFTMFDWPESGEMEVVCTESPLGMDFLREPAQVLKYREIWEYLIAKAAPVQQTAPIIRRVLRERYSPTA